MEDWKKKVEKLKYEENKSWMEVAQSIAPYFPNLNAEQLKEKARGCLRGTDKYKASQNKPTSIVVTDEQIISAIKVKRTVQQDADILHMPVIDFVRRMDKLSQDGYNIIERNGLVWLETSPIITSGEIREKFNGETEIIFGLVSDTHFCNKHQQLTYLNNFYDRCLESGIKTIYHVGDISDGFYKNRPDHIYELFKIGFDEQAEYIIENYPKRKGITTKFISGNHDSTHLKNGGSDIGKRIAIEREDMEYLGYMNTKVWLTPQCDMDLLHPLDGGSYALSYQLQKHIDGLQGGQKPRILACGHYHKAFYMLYRNIHAFCVPCFESQTGFEKGKHLAVMVGGWIVRIKCKPDGTVVSISPELVPYYDMIDENY